MREGHAGLTLGGVAELRTSLVRLVFVGAMLSLSWCAFAQDPTYRLGLAMPSRWISPAAQSYYLPPEGSAPGLAFTSSRCSGGPAVPGGVTERTLVWCTLATPSVSPESRLHGWSFSLRAEGAKLLSAGSTFGAMAEFENTEVTSGEGNLGVVSTVVLSQGFPGATAVSGGTFPIASIQMEATAPRSGCAEIHLRYEDGLRDSKGAVIRNEVLSPVPARLELEPCSTDLCAATTDREVCDNARDDDGDAKIDMNDTDCVAFPHPGDCSFFFFECGCHLPFELFFVTGDRPLRPRSEVLAIGERLAILGARTAVSLRGFELSGRTRSVSDGFLLELTGDVPDEKGEPVRHIFLDTLGNRIPPRVRNAVLAPVGWIEAVERGPDLEPFGATDFLSVDIGSGPTGPSFTARYAADPASQGAVISPIVDGRFCTHRILTVKFGPSFHRGDANGDGALTITDPIVVLLHLFGGVPLACLEAGNADDDSRVSVTDAIRLLMYLFATGDAPSPPGPPGTPCGPDLTWSTPFIPCSSYDGC